MVVNRRFTEMIAADWAERAYYDKAEESDWLAIFWREGSRFKERFDMLCLRSVLELACGHGRHAAQFIDKAESITLVDVNKSNIDYCRERFGGFEKIKFVVNNGSDLSDIMDQQFSAVFSYDAMVHFELEDVINYLKECHRVLAPGGRALLHMSDHSINPGALYNANPHWRNFMSLEIGCHVGQRAGLRVIDSDRFPWGAPVNDVVVHDCLILFERPAT